MLKNIKNSGATKVLTVVVLLSLGKESTKRVQNCFAENAIVDEHAEAVKVATAAKKKYTSIIRLGGNTSVFTSVLATTKYNKTKSPKQRAKGFYINQAVSQR
jgi:hypothetical protein